MNLKHLVLVGGLMLSMQAQATIYNCYVFRMTNSGNQNIGQMASINASKTMHAQKIIVNSSRDYVACESVKEPSMPGVLLCYFSDAQSEVQTFKFPGKSLVSVMKRNSLTGEVHSTPVAETEDGASLLTLLLPVANSTLGVMCVSQDRVTAVK